MTSQRVERSGIRTGGYGRFRGEWVNLFLIDLAVAQYCQDSDLTKYADDTSIFVTVRKNSVDESQKALNAFLEWTDVNGMSCNTSKCKELCMAKKGVTPNLPPLCGIEQSHSFTLLGVTLQKDCKFSSHVKGKLREANKRLYILRSLRKDGYTQVEIDHLFKATVLPKITHALRGNGASQVDLNTIHCFLKGAISDVTLLRYRKIPKISPSMYKPL